MKFKTKGHYTTLKLNIHWYVSEEEWALEEAETALVGVLTTVVARLKTVRSVQEQRKGEQE